MYRDPDNSALATFAKHVQIAEALYVVNIEHLEALTQYWEAERRQAYAMSWLQLWEQLDQARTIVVRFGRDVTAVDAAWRCGNPNAIDQQISRGNREAALRAFAEIRRCMPEVVVPTEIPTAKRDAPSPARLSTWTRLLLLALLLFLVVVLVR